MMKFLLIAFLATQYFVKIAADSKHLELMAKLMAKEDNGQMLSFGEVLSFVKTCLQDHVSAEIIDSEYMSITNKRRNLLDVSSFHCLPYSTAHSSNASTAHLPQCLISNVLPGTTLLISDCSSSCVGDQYLRLYDTETNTELLSNDDGKF